MCIYIFYFKQQHNIITYIPSCLGYKLVSKRSTLNTHKKWHTLNTIGLHYNIKMAYST
jgi:hypothetical protein